MPRRPRAHQLEEESRLAFAQALAPRYLFREETRDYGIDGEVEEFDADARATGLRYLVQLKATDESELPAALNVRITAETATYYRSLTLPVLMVRYLSDGERLFARWFHNPSRRSSGETKTILFEWREEDVWTEDAPERIATEARAFLAIRSNVLSLPIPFALDAPQEALGVSRVEIAMALRRAFRPRADIIQFLGEPAADRGSFRVSEEELAVDLPGFTAATYGLDGSYDAGAAADQLAADLLTLAALAFADWGQDAAAGRLASTFFAESSLATIADAAGVLAGAMTRSRQIREALELSERLDSREEDESHVASNLFTLAALHHGRSLTSDELEAYRGTLRARIDRRVERGEPEEAGRNCVSLANSYRTRAEPNEAVEWYRKAVEYDPGYERRTHYWFELAGVLFGSHRYDEAAEAYERAADLGARPIVGFLRADALMFAGHFQSAHEAFGTADWTDVEFGVAAEYGLKTVFMAELMSEYDLLDQRRDPEAALKAAEVPAEARGDPDLARTLMGESLALDGLCALAWWNLGHAVEQLGDKEVAGQHALAAALCWEGDVESWAAATIGAWYFGEIQRVPAIVVTGERMTDGALLPRLAALAREQGDDFPLAVFLEALDAMANELLVNDQGGSYEVRIIGPDGVVETVQVPSATAGRASGRNTSPAPGDSKSDPA